MTSWNEPLVSIIMPAFNGERFISEAIQSVINQTYKHWELHIVDDASTDSTLTVAKSFTDSRIHIHENNENRGISYSSNYAIDKSKSKYIALLDDDDMATEDRLELQVSYLEEHSEADVLGGRAIEIDGESNIIKYDNAPLYNPKLIWAYMHFVNKRFTNGTTMIRRSLLDDNHIRFEEGCYGMQDWKLMIDCSKVGSITSIDRLLQYKRIHDNEFTTIMRESNLDNRRECAARFQRESLKSSGYVLRDEQLNLIGTFINEKSPIPSEEEIKELWKTMSDIICQTERVKPDSISEMEYACKTLMCERFLMKKDVRTFDKIFSFE